jgi:hypothetical protein
LHTAVTGGNRMARTSIGRSSPLRVEVITYAPTVFYHCQHCELTFQQMGLGDRLHRKEARDALPDDLREEFHALSDWVHRVNERHGERVRMRIVDAASIEGFWKSLRHRAHRYPAVIIGRNHRVIGADVETLDAELERHLVSSPQGGATSPQS